MNLNRLALYALSLTSAAILVACGGGGSEGGVQPTAAGASAPADSAPVDSNAGAFMAEKIQADGAGVEATGIDSRLRDAKGKVNVWVALNQNSLASARALLAQNTGIARVRALNSGQGQASAAQAEPASVKSAMASQRAKVLSQQATLSQTLAGMGAVELGRVSVAHNAIAVTIDASQLKSIAALPGVLSVRPVVNYELHLGETVPYVGGTTVQGMGYDGTGVTVAVLDSGVDYTHKNLGGTGTLADYNTCYAQRNIAPTGACAALFGPAAPKVIGGYDFVGETWPSTATQPDPNPIDFQGHGTHVADIIAGKSADGTHKGVAPGAKIVAVKVCSAVATSCNGVALLQGVDFALDPNGDGDLSDSVDVMNLSLGSDYGQIEDDLTQALTNAVNFGVSVVASAGNGSDRPYKVGSPSISPGVISVAQTQVPSAKAIPLLVNAPATIAGLYSNTETLAFAPVGSNDTTGDIKTALQAGGTNNLACAPLPAGSLAGKIALIDRGTCSVSLKVEAAANAGAIGVLIALVAPGDAITFSYGGGTNFVPSLVIQQSLGTAIKARLAASQTVNASIKASVPIPLVGSMAGSSSRGPSMSTQGIKPEIGAPGASLSAQVGTGAGETAFGGTSGAAPMVAGAAALMLQAHPARTPLQIKAMLMNSAETNVYTSPAFNPGQLAPITRIGAGELRVNRSVLLGSAAWDTEAKSATLSFGAVEADKQTVVKRTLTVENFSGTPKQFNITSSFRYADDEASDAVRVQAPSTVNVAPNSSATVQISLLINATRLPTWTLNGGSSGGNGLALNGPEYDGYVTLVAESETLSVPWHVLPRKAARLNAANATARGANQLTFVNTGAETGQYDVFSLVGSSPQLPASDLPAPGDNYAVVDLRSVGVRYLAAAQCGVSGGCLQFAINTYERRAHPLYPGGLEVDIDTNGDGVVDYFVDQIENGGFGVTGQSVVRIVNLKTNAAAAYFFNDADLNSGNSTFTIPMSAIGVGPGTTLTLDVYAYDNYFSGFVSDALFGMKFTPASPRFSASTQIGTVPSGSSSRVPFTTNETVTAAQSSESGLLLMYRRNADFESQEVLRP
jgi:minor extracellular serine protease Vpr